MLICLYSHRTRLQSRFTTRTMTVVVVQTQVHRHSTLTEPLGQYLAYVARSVHAPACLFVPALNFSLPVTTFLYNPRSRNLNSTSQQSNSSSISHQTTQTLQTLQTLQINNKQHGSYVAQGIRWKACRYVPSSGPEWLHFAGIREILTDNRRRCRC